MKRQLCAVGLGLTLGLSAFAQVEPYREPTQGTPGVQLPTPSPSPAPPAPPIPPASPSAAIGTVDPSRYRLDAGDILTLVIEGPRPTRFELPVWADGGVVLPPAGRIAVAGLTVREAEKRLTRAYARYRKHFRMLLSLSAIRHFQIQIVGAVARPGVYEVDGLTHLFQALQQAGGVTQSGSTRAIRLYSDAGLQTLLGQADLKRWQMFGQVLPDSNLWLRSRQVIMVPNVGATVHIRGQVQNPGAYEILPGETARDVVRMAGGFSPTADASRVLLGRLGPAHTREQQALDLTQDPGAGLSSGDELEVFDVTLQQPAVTVSGELQGKDFFPETVNTVSGMKELQRRGRYRIRQGETLKELVLALGGPTVKADLRHSRIETRSADGSVKVDRVDLYAILNEQAPDVPLLGGQDVIVPPLPDTVFVVGQVVRPGPVPYTANLSLRDYLSLAGGTTPQAATKHGRVVRCLSPDQPPQIFEVDFLDVLEGSSNGPELRPGDVVFCPLYQPFLTDIFQVLSSLFYVGNFSYIFRR